MTPTIMAGGLIAHGTRTEFLGCAEFFGRLERGAFFAFFIGTDILLSEIFWSFRSAQSTYRIQRGGSFTFFRRTEVLLLSPFKLFGSRRSK